MVLDEIFSIKLLSETIAIGAGGWGGVGAPLGQVKGEPGGLRGVGTVASGSLWPWLSRSS